MTYASSMSDTVPGGYDTDSEAEITNPPGVTDTTMAGVNPGIANEETFTSVETGDGQTMSNNPDASGPGDQPFNPTIGGDGFGYDEGPPARPV